MSLHIVRPNTAHLAVRLLLGDRREELSNDGVVKEELVKPVMHTCGEELTPEVLTALGRVASEVTVSIHLAETGPFAIASYTSRDQFQSGCVGLPYTRVRVRILGDDLKEAPAGVTGFIALKGPSVFKEYYMDKEATRRAFVLDSQTFKTGCRGFLDEKGQLHLTSGSVSLPAQQ